MSLRGKQGCDLDKLVRLISSFEEVIAIILFGSIARGDYDEYSDYDILVIFKDKKSMWRRWDDLFKSVGKLGLLIHLIPKSYEEFLNSEPTFLDEIYKHGILLYMKYPFIIRLRPPHLKHEKLITYDLSGLEQKDKVKLLYMLYGKKGLRKRGILSRLGGDKICDGCIIVPAENSAPLLRILREYRVKIRVLDVYVGPSHE